MKQKVLIVDDEPRNQRIIIESLEDMAELKTASSGEEAWAIMQTWIPDLVLLDIMMPGIDGYQLCKQIKSDKRIEFTKVILVSGKAMIDERLKGYEVGADDYMTKPFVPEELVAKTKVFLRLTEAEKSLGEINLSLEKKVEERTKTLTETQAKLAAAAKMSALGEMAGGIAHEINTPLATIGLLISQMEELITDDPIDKDLISEHLTTIGETVKRISTIITGLRFFSRDGSHDNFSQVALTEVVKNTLVLCQEKLKHSNIQLTVEPIAESLQVDCRSVQISQVLVNLVGNSCDAIQNRPEKWIRIAAKVQGDQVEISVTDSGEGIPESVREKMFQPFYTTKEVGKGTGLGLSISKGILESHKGSLCVNRESKNTQFVIRLPLKRESSQAKAG